MEFVTEELEPPTDGIFSVDAQWSLEWDEREKDSETTQCIRENPDEWVSDRNWGQCRPPPTTPYRLASWDQRAEARGRG